MDNKTILKALISLSNETMRKILQENESVTMQELDAKEKAAHEESKEQYKEFIENYNSVYGTN